MKRFVYFLALGLCVGPLPVKAQVTAMRQEVGSVQHAGTPEAFASLIDLLEADILPVARAMPAEKYSFSPDDLHVPGASFHGVRSFADQVRHVTEANYHIFAEAGGLPVDPAANGLGTLKSKDELVRALADSLQFARKAVAQLSRENATIIIPGPQLANRETMAAHGIAHAYDHYGQMVEYLRMNGIVPPSSK